MAVAVAAAQLLERKCEVPIRQKALPIPDKFSLSSLPSTLLQFSPSAILQLHLIPSPHLTSPHLLYSPLSPLNETHLRCSPLSHPPFIKTSFRPSSPPSPTQLFSRRPTSDLHPPHPTSPTSLGHILIRYVKASILVEKLYCTSAFPLSRQLSV